MTTPLKDLTFSEQKGPPGHCFGAQVWGPDGQSVAVIESTDDPANATSFARLFALSPRLLAFARDIATNYDHEGRDECYRGCRVCAAEELLAEYEASKPVRPGET